MSDVEAPVAAPTGVLNVARQLGPGLIITAVIVGSGELIVTPKLGASAGFQLLWFIVLGCLLKVFVQIELGRHAVAHGMTTLAALDRLPGPRLRVSWVLWLWLLMYVSLVFQVAGMVGGVASIFSIAGVPLSVPATAVLVGLSCAVLLLIGRYRFVEALSTLPGGGVHDRDHGGRDRAAADAVRGHVRAARRGLPLSPARVVQRRLRGLRHHRGGGVRAHLLPVLVPREGLRAPRRPQRRLARPGASGRGAGCGS